MDAKHKKRLKIVLIISAIAIVLAAAALIVLPRVLQKGETPQSTVPQAPSVYFQEDTVSIEKFESYQLGIYGADGKTVTWKSQDEEIVTVEDGVICGWKKGNTQILANVGGIELSCNIIVTDNQYVPVIKLRETDELALDLGGTYSLHPVLCYNAKEYTDAQYTYSSVGDAVTVDENGVIQAVQTGEATVCVQGKWRGNDVEATLTVYVIDVSTSVEVSNNVFDIYLNSADKEFPSSADLGLAIYERDTLIPEEDASIKYIELLMEGDVEGAATVKDGVVYAKKIGTTHFVAEFTPVEGEAVRTAVFTVNVHKSPSDIYMSPIAGVEYESFITPMNPMNTVKWDEELGAFHLANLNEAEDDGRAFLLSRDYIEKILRYTNAKSIVFEVKSDGIASNCPAPDQVIYQGFYPQWYDGNNYTRIDKCDEWTKIEIFFDKIPLDSDGNRKSIMLLTTKEGMYIRNIRPMTEGSFLTMDLEMTTLGGNWTKDVEIGLYPHSYKGSINDYNNRVTIQAGTKTTVKVRLDDFLENGKVPGFGLVVYGGPAWNAKLPDGYTPDRHTLKISNLRVTGETNYSLDLGTAAWKTGKDGTGFTDANGSGVPNYDEGIITITNGFCYDGHKFTLNSEEAKNRTYLCLDMQIDTLGGDWTNDIEVRFYPYGFEGNPHEKFADRTVIKAGKKTTVKINAAEYLVNGELPGIGIGIFGGPQWDAKLPDGFTPDRHTVTISGIRLEGALNASCDLSRSAFASGTVDTGYTVANGSGKPSIVDGAIVITDGFCYDAHKIRFNATEGPSEEEPKTQVVLDMQIDTLGGNWTNDIEIRFYPHNFEGNPHENYTDKIIFKAGEQQTVKLDAEKYLADGELTGIGIGIFGGPTWDAKLPDGYTPDRHTVTISGITLEGEQNVTYDLSKTTCLSGTVDTGYTVANGSGVAAFTDGVLKISNGFCYDCHKLSLSKTGESETPEEQETYVVLDMQIDTLSGNYGSINMGFYPHNFAGDINNHTDIIEVPTGTTYTVKLNASDYLVDGEIPGIGIAVLGGPAWDAKLPDGYTPDRHSITITSIYLEGPDAQTINLNNVTLKSGQNGTGYTNANAGGTATVADGKISITGGFFTDGYKITFGEENVPGEGDPETPEEQDTYICVDMLFTTLGNSTDPLEIGFFPSNFEGDINNWTDKVTITSGTTATIKLDAEKYLVDGKISGIGFAIFGGPAWDAKLPDGYTPDRHTVTISGVYLEGAQSTVYDLSQSVVASGTNGTGYTNANGSGVATIGESIVITNGFRYDGHKISLVAESQPGDTDKESYVVLDMQIDTLGGNWTKDIEMRFYAYNFAGNPHEVYTDKVIFKAGEKTTVKLEADKYLVDGKLTGIGIGIFGGPEWNTQISAGVYDRHTVTIFSVKLEGKETQTYDLSQSACISGTGDTGYTVANGSGVASFADGILKITNGFCYDCHKISFGIAESRGITRHNTWLAPFFPAKKEA